MQFRFRRAPWLIEGRSAAEVIRENIRLTSMALQSALGIKPAGFRTPGGFANGLADRPDVQQMLLDLGFTWVSSKYPAHASGEPGEPPPRQVYDRIVAAQAEAQPFAYPSGLIEVPMSPISDVTAFRSGRWKLDWFLRAIRAGRRVGHPQRRRVRLPGPSVVPGRRGPAVRDHQADLRSGQTCRRSSRVDQLGCRGAEVWHAADYMELRDSGSPHKGCGTASGCICLRFRSPDSITEVDSLDC